MWTKSQKEYEYKEKTARAKVLPDRRNWQKTDFNCPTMSLLLGSCTMHYFTSLSTRQTCQKSDRKVKIHLLPYNIYSLFF
jgi:hypothetical protein